jgi:isoquinoline 1-oxidoreductase subunit beta
VELAETAKAIVPGHTLKLLWTREDDIRGGHYRPLMVHRLKAVLSAEVSLRDGTEPIVHDVWCAVDCGIVVNPDVVRAQMEGGIGFALGHALFGEVPIVKGTPTVSNFNGYRSLTIKRMPRVHVAIVASSEKPTGVGEPGVPALAPAVANAIGRLTGRRPTRLPFLRRS